MDASAPHWPAFMILLTSIIHQNWGLGVACTGNLTLDPGPLVEWGSSVNVLCQIKECSAGPRNPFSITRNYKPLAGLVQNCTTARLHIANVTASVSRLYCLKGRQLVCGLDLKSGHRPAKATQFNCFTPIKSDTINCSWTMNGREPHLPTNYSVIFSSVNGSKNFTCQRPDCSSISIPRTNLSEITKYDVRVIAQNALGNSTSGIFAFSVRDVEIPNAPTIKRVNFTHMNGSSFLITWNSLESSEHLKHSIRLRLRGELIWQEGDATESSGSGGSATVEGLKAKATYMIELRVCTQVAKPKCSLWSAPMGAVTPAPTQKPVAWRTVCHTEKHGVQDVTVLWESMKSGDFIILHYEVSYWQHGQSRRVHCPVSVSEVQLQLPAEVKEVNLTAVTSAGSSPPASLSLTHTNVVAPVMRVSCSKEDTVLLSWLWKMEPGVAGSLLGYVVQWQCKDSPVQWKRLSRDCSSTNITGLTPGWRYDMLLQAETTRGLSKPAFLQVYSKEITPGPGPKPFIHNIGSKHIQVRWEEPKLEDQRGFITHYTVYIRKHGTGNWKPMSQVNASSPRELSLEILDPGFDICISAWNAAGEGEAGEHISYKRLKSDVKIWVVTVVSLVLVAYLICLKCVRTRIRAVCLTLGPAWLSETFPKVGNSNAIKLLKDERCGSDSLWMSACSDSDPPISPVEDIAEPIAQAFLFPSARDEEKAKVVRVARPEIVDPYKPQWADSCEVSSTLLSDTPEEAPEEDTEDECPLWACLPQPSSGKDIGLGDVTLGGFKGIGVTGDFLCPPLLVPKQTEWHTNMNAGMGDMGGFSLALLTEGQTVLPHDLLTTGSLQTSPYSPQGCWLKVAHNT
ncbi:interleukin-23 receptor isoform X2 [Sardina pilchardus]|uniref:interleukin-23 receptor isoform X2 n=1 Tax=Sardina pilchardus TaxID=27697 RepID=UPI002E1074D9